MERFNKHSFSLVEVFVALMLFTMIIPPIVSCFKTFAKQENVLVKLKNECEALALCHARLQKTLTSLKSTNTKPPLFFCEDDVLVFSYDNGVDSPAFSNIILGKIFEENGKLLIASFPYPTNPQKKEVEMRKEELLSGISSFKMEFWTADSQGGKNQNEPKEKVWHDVWEKDLEKVPILMNMHFVYNGKDHTFFFVIPNSIRKITYEK